MTLLFLKTPKRYKMNTDLKKLIARHNFRKEPESGLLLLAEIFFKDKTSFNLVFFYIFFDEESLEKAKEDLNNLTELPKDFSDQLERVEVLDEGIKMECEEGKKKIRLFKNYFNEEYGSVRDEKNLEKVKSIIANTFPEYFIEVVLDNKIETTIAANLNL